MSSKPPPKGNEKQPAAPASFNLLPKVINGGIAGMIGVSIVFPLDLSKTRLQNQVIGPNGERQYKGLFDCLRKTYASDGYFGMYRGSAINILLVTPEKAIKLASNDMFRFYLTLPDGTIPLPRQMLAGGMAGACQITITTPMDLLKIQMQDQGRVKAQGLGSANRLTIMGLLKQLISERGIFGLYRGIQPTACRDISFSMIYFPLFATLSHIGVEGPISSTTAVPLWKSFLSGLGAGSTAAFIDTPLDVVKTRMQTIAKGRGEKTYTSMADCIMTTYRNEGLSAFFKGSYIRVMVIAPLFGIAQTVYYIGIAEKLFGL